ncbi:MAG: InlB B-repeat-containing protein [Kiritimatiellae bacterium]|nr:InlB B-repeat-containing protein [Kiritimatiellia bacterium]
MREIKRFCLTVVMAVVGILPAVSLATTVGDFNSLKNAVKDGGKVTLNADITVTATMPVSKDLTVDLNGNKLSGGQSLFKLTGGTLTIEDGTGANPDVTAGTGPVVQVNTLGSNVIVKNGKYNVKVIGFTDAVIAEAVDEAAFYEVDDLDLSADINISGGEFTANSIVDIPEVEGYDSDGVDVTITGGTFSANPAQYGYIPTDAIDGYYAVTQVSGGYQVLPAVATDGTSYYANLTDAVNGTAANGTITLIADTTLGTAISKAITIDTDGYDLTVDPGNAYYCYISADVTIKNSKYNAASPKANGVVTVKDYGISPKTGSTLTIESGCFVADGDYLFYLMGGGLVINGGTFEGEYSVINCYASGNYAYGGNVEINGGNFKGGAEGVLIMGWANSEIAISGGTFDGNGGYILATGLADVNDPSADSGTITVTGGTFSDGTIGAYEGAELVISDGTFNGCDMETEDEGDIAVSGGSFDSEVPEEFCALGFLPQDNGDGTYGVQRGAIVEFSVFGEITTEVVEKGSSISALAPATPDKPTETYYYVFAYWSADGGTTKYQTNELPAPTADIKYIAYFKKYYTMYERNGNYYKSFSDAIAEAEADATLKLMYSGSTQIYANGSNIDVTIDLNGNTITRTDNYTPVVVTGGAKVTLTNGSIVYNYQQTASGAYPAIIALGGSTLVLGEDLEIINEYSHTTEGNDYYGYGVMVYDDAKVTLDGATITADYGVSVFGDNDETTGDATFEMISGEIESSVFGVANNGNLSNSGTLIQIKGGTITCDEVGIYHPGSGTLEISGGEISGGTAVYVKSGSVSVTDGTFTANADADEYAYYGNGVKPVTGDAFVIDNCGYPGGTPAASITGGTFISENAEPIASYASGTDSITGEDREPIGSFVSGGSFSSPVPDEYTSDGKASTLVLNNDNLYVVVNAKTITWDVDGAQTTDKVAVGEMPSYEGTPTKVSEGNTSYAFIGWTPELVVVAEDATYTAQFDATGNGYYVATLTFSVMGMWTQNKTFYLKLTEASIESAKSAVVNRWNLGMGSASEDAKITALTDSTEEVFNTANAIIKESDQIWIGTPASFAEILNFAADEDTVILNKDLDTGNAGIFKMDGGYDSKSVTVDLNGHTLTDTSSGSTVPAIDDESSLTFTGEGTFILQDNHELNTDLTVGPNVIVKQYVAMIGSTKYFSLAEAIGNASDGDTIILLNDDTESFLTGGIVIDKNLTIDGNNKTIKGVSDAAIANVTVGATSPDVEFDGVNGTNVRGFFVKSGNVTFSNLTMTEFGDTDYLNKFGYTPIQTATAYAGTLTLTNVNIDKFNRQAVCIRGGNFEITGGSVNGNAVNKGAGFDHLQYGIEIRGGSGTVSGVTVRGMDSNITGLPGIGIVSWSDGAVTVENVNIDVTDIGIDADGNAVTVQGADTIVKAAGKALFVEDNGTLSVTAGTYNGALAVDDTTGGTIAVSGGTFDASVPFEYCASGFIPKDNGDGTYTVEPGYRIALQKDDGTMLQAINVATTSENSTVASGAELKLYPNCSEYVYVVGALEGSTYRFVYAPSSVIGSGGYSTTAGWGKPNGKTPGTGTVTAIISKNNEQVAQLVANVTVKDVVAVVDGVEYTTADWATAVSTAIANDQVLEVYKAVSTVTLAEGQTLRWKYIGTTTGTGDGRAVTTTPQAANADYMYAVTKTTDAETGVTTAVCAADGSPNVEITKANGTVTYAADLTFSANGVVNKLLRSFASSRKSVTYQNVVLDLNGQTVTFDTANTDYAGILIGSSAKSGSLTICDTSAEGAGSIVDSGIPVWAAYNSSSVTVEGGSIVAGAGCNAVYASKNSTITITGGSFENTGSATYLINMKDDERGTVTVTGGSFKGFDPANNTAEGAGTGFVAEGYVSVADDPESGWYTVRQVLEVTFVNEKTDPVTSTKVKVPQGLTVAKPMAPEAAGYDFAGWFAPEAEEAFAFTTPITANLTLTAGWTPTVYEITYVLNGGVWEEEDGHPTTYTVENYPELVSPTKTGYAFDGWLLDDEEEETITAIPEGTLGNITLTATWTPAKVNYTVEHYQADLNADTYTIVDSDTETKEGYTESDTEAVAKTYEGFTEKAFDQAEILADGSTVVKIYYDRNTYTVTWVNDGKTIETDTAVQFGDTPSYGGETPTRAPNVETGTAYAFDGWDPAITSDTLVIADVTYTAQFRGIVKKARIDTNDGSTYYESIDDALADATDDTKIYVYNYTDGEKPEGWLYDEDDGYLYRAAASATVGGIAQDFGTLQDALDEVDDGGTVTLLRNVSECAWTDYACTLDLNGKTLTGVVVPFQDFTVADGSEDGNGTIVLPASLDEYFVDELLGEDEEIDGAVWAMDGVTVTIAGGTFGNPAVVLWNEGADVVLAGGTFTGPAVVVDSEFEAAYTVKKPGDISATVTVSGGTFGGTDDYLVKNSKKVKGLTLLIEGGFHKVLDAKTAQTIDRNGVTVSGGCFSYEPNADFIAEDYEAVANTDDETSAEYPWTVAKVIRTAIITSISVNDANATATVNVAIDNPKGGAAVKLWAKINYTDNYWSQVDEGTISGSTVTFSNVPVSYNTVYTATVGEFDASSQQGGNVVGTLAVTLNSFEEDINMVIGVPYSSVEGTETITLGELFQNNTLAVGDTVVVSGAEYVWSGTGWSEDAAVTPGTAIEFVRAPSVASRTVRINGEVKPTQTAPWLNDGWTVEDEITVLANPNPSAVSVQDIPCIGSGDMLVYVDAATGAFVYAEHDSTGWYVTTYAREDWKSVSVKNYDLTVQAGGAFYYVHY